MTPDYQTLMAPVLRQLIDGSEHAVKDMAAAMAVDFGLTPDEHGGRLDRSGQAIARPGSRAARPGLSCADGVIQSFSPLRNYSRLERMPVERPVM